MMPMTMTIMRLMMLVMLRVIAMVALKVMTMTLVKILIMITMSSYLLSSIPLASGQGIVRSRCVSNDVRGRDACE